MNNQTHTLPAEFLDSDNLPKVESVLFSHGGNHYAFVSDDATPWYELSSRFPENTKRVSGMLSSTAYNEGKAFIFYQSDCFDPCVYVQFGSDFADAYDSFCDNEPALLIPEEDLNDYDMAEHSNYTSDGKPIDTDTLQGFGPLSLVSITFKA